MYHIDCCVRSARRGSGRNDTVQNYVVPADSFSQCCEVCIVGEGAGRECVGVYKGLINGGFYDKKRSL